MARTFEELKTIFNEAYVQERSEAGLPAEDPAIWSRVSRKSLFRAVQCFLSFTVESLFDLFKSDVDKKIKELKPHSERWYATKALMFQYGFNLLPDSDEFDNTGYTDTQIQDSKVVKYAAVVEGENQYGRLFLRVKLATVSGGDLSQLSAPQLAGATGYLQRIKDAGVKLQIDSLPFDSIKMTWKIYYDPLILDNQGNRLDGTQTDAIRTAVKGYLKKLPFNGIYVVQYHIDELQLIDGVVIAEVQDCQTKYGVLPFIAVNVKITPDAGYMRFAADEDLEIEYIPQAPIR
jgi:hypothetical protein